MSNANGPASPHDFDDIAQRDARRRPLPDPLGSRSDPLSSEDIDAQIRWFFDNARERKPKHP